MSTLYISTSETYKNHVYGFDENGQFTMLSSNWNTLTDENKAALFELTGNRVATSSQPSGISPFYFVSFVASDSDQVYSYQGVPADQVVLPKELMDLGQCEKLNSITITATATGNASIKVALTNDGTNFKVFNGSAWTTIDPTVANMTSSGMTVSAVNALTAAQLLLFTGDLVEQPENVSKIGFAYLLHMVDGSETCKVQSVSLSVDMQGGWQAMAPFADYAYSYPDPTHMSVTFAATGTYHINHER